ncbi:hypothetical protein LSCM1_00452 [Leishmania martiniquensis]|uniref:Arrestin-like N-terminal domain-containing protein n=1 Tax=Leishmania martiniquensis TaxID=1580590 RepID=A0A836K8S1_9TRYP|nr:hypothetical protein LSCM1_00452 [Leishmania martiniquensis]
MFRKRRLSKEMEPEVVLLLRHPSRYPGDLLQGVVLLDIPSPCDMLALEARIRGDERSILGGLLFTDKNLEARKTIYYEQLITLREVDHDLLETKFTLHHRHESAAAQGLVGGPNSAPSPPSSAGGAVPKLSASVAQRASEAAIHLIPGTYSYPFSLLLPDNLPASRELSRGHDGSCVLRYRVTASLFMKSGKVHTSEARLRVNPLPVQVQRWYQLHKDEQRLSVGVSDSGDVDDDETESRTGFMSRLMSSPGTTRANKEERNSDITCQRRLRHYRQFPEEQLALETAAYLETAAERAKKKKQRMRESDTRERDSPLKETEATAFKKKGSASVMRSQQEHEEVENRSLDSEDGATGAANDLDVNAKDEVYAFGPEDSLTALAASIQGEEKCSRRVNDSIEETSAASPIALEESEAQKKQRHHRPEKDEAGRSAMVERNVEKLTLSLPGEGFPQLPAHMAVRYANETEAVSNEAAHGSSEENREGGQSHGTQPHRRRRHRFHPPPWKQEFFINLRSGFLSTGRVRVVLSLRSPLVTVGVGKVDASLLIDNSHGSGAISRIKYSLVTRCYIRTKAEVYNFEVDTVETSTDVSVEKGKVVNLPEVQLPVPKSTPLTMLTEGMGTLTFLRVRLYVDTTLKTFSRSVATEVLLVSGQDVLNCSRRLLRWSCFFRRPSGNKAGDITLRPPTINLSEKNSKLRVVDAGGRGTAMEQANPSSQSDDTGVSFAASPAASRAMRILRASHRSAKTAPLDTRVLAKALNYEEAVFVPCGDGDDVSGFPKHMDPMAGLNPFAAPASSVQSALAEGGNSEALCH